MNNIDKIIELRKNGSKLEKLIKQFTLTELKNAGMTVKEMLDERFLVDVDKNKYTLRYPGEKRWYPKFSEMKKAGFKIKDMDSYLYLYSLRDIGFTLKDFFEAGYNVSAMYGLGFETKDMIDVGFDLSYYGPALLKRRGCTLRHLKKTGFTVDDLKKSNIKNSYNFFTDEDLKEFEKIEIK